MIRAGVRTDSMIEGRKFECRIGKQNRDDPEILGISRARSYRTLRDGSFGVAVSQALRARLRSACPSGTKGIRPSKGLVLS